MSNYSTNIPAVSSNTTNRNNKRNTRKNNNTRKKEPNCSNVVKKNSKIVKCYISNKRCNTFKRSDSLDLASDSGHFGIMHHVCCDDTANDIKDCGYIMKRSRISPSGFFKCLKSMWNVDKYDCISTTLDDFKNELQLQNKAAQGGVAPNIIKAYIERLSPNPDDLDSSAIIIMEKMKMTLNNYCIEFINKQYKIVHTIYNNQTNRDKNLKEIRNTVQLVAIKTANDICKIIHKLHNLGIYHCDVHSNNIMLSMNNEWKIIDFGLSQYLYHVENNINEENTINSRDRVGLTDYDGLMDNFYLPEVKNNNNNNKSFVNEMRKLRLIFINSFKNEVKRYYR